MAFKHVSANRLIFLLSNEGIPSGLTINDEQIPIGSLSIDRNNGRLYQLKPGNFWQEVASGLGATPIIEELTTASTSAPYTYELAFNPINNTLQLFVNGNLAVKGPGPTTYHYTLSDTTITWDISAPYMIDSNDQVIAYYDTNDI